MKSIKFTVLFTVLVYFKGNAQSYHRLDSISKIQWLRIDVQGALISNNSFSNLPFKFLHPETTGSADETDYIHTKNNSKPVSFGFNTSIEFVLGRNPYVKHLLSLTYDLTNSRFNSFGGFTDFWNHGERQAWHETVTRRVQFVNLNYGTLFNITKKLKLATIASVNFFVKQTDITNGYFVDYYPAVYNLPAQYDSTNYNNSKTTSGGVGIMFSLKLRSSYVITKYLSVFVQRNFGITYKAPWWMLGLQFYPFKKLR